MRENRYQPAFKKVAAGRPALARGAKSANRHERRMAARAARREERIEMSVVNTKEANVDNDDDINESLEADADAAIGFSEQRAALRRALRALARITRTETRKARPLVRTRKRRPVRPPFARKYCGDGCQSERQEVSHTALLVSRRPPAGNFASSRCSGCLRANRKQKQKGDQTAARKPPRGSIMSDVTTLFPPPAAACRSGAPAPRSS